MSIGLGVLDAGLLPQEGLRLVIVVAVLDRFRLRPVRRGPGVTISGPVDPVSGSAVVVVVPLWKDVQTGRTHRFVNAPKMDFLPSNGQAFAASFVNFVVN